MIIGGEKMSKYNQEFQIYFRDVDIRGRLSFAALVDFMQETARNHALRLGINYSGPNDQYYWIVVRTKMQWNKIPRLGECIRIETYIEGLDKLYSVRRFNIYDEEGMVLGYILAYYLLMNKEDGRPVKLKLLEGKESVFCNAYQGEVLRKLKNEQISEDRVITRKAYSSDIDTNNHMNNAHYIRWIVDMFTTAELSHYHITSLQIQYVKEVRENQEIHITRGRTSAGELFVIGKNDKEEINFISNAKIEKITHNEDSV